MVHFQKLQEATNFLETLAANSKPEQENENTHFKNV
jgi:hypothetical protein